MSDLRAALAERLDSKERSYFLATLLRLARVDEVSLVERDRLMPVAQWMGASQTELTFAMQQADDPSVSSTQLVEPFSSLEERYLLFREACAIVWADGRCSDDEQRMLDSLATLLNISPDAREVMDTPLACSPEGERRFLELMALTHEAPPVDSPKRP